MKLQYNLQFFAEEEEDENDNNIDNDGDSGTGDNTETGIDAEAFAELISEKDKRIEQLEKDVKLLKKNNADLTVKISAQNKPDKNIGEVIVDFCDTRKVK